MTEKKDKPKNEAIAEMTVNLERCNPRVMYMWQEFARSKLSDGTPVIVGTVIPSGSLYIFVGAEGTPKERYHVDNMALVQKALNIVEDLRQEEALQRREDFGPEEEDAQRREDFGPYGDATTPGFFQEAKT